MSEVPVPNGRVRALIVDDNPGFRQEMRVLLELEEVTVVGEAANGWEAVQMSEALDPDVILMDQNMPALSGIDATRRIKQTRPDRRVLFVAAEEAWRQEAMRAGAEAYFVKGEGFSQLVRAILQPGFAGVPQRDCLRQRRAVLRKAGVALGGVAVLALTISVLPLSLEWLPAVALLFAPFSFVLYLLGGD